MEYQIVLEAIQKEKDWWDDRADIAMMHPTDGRPSQYRQDRDTAHEALKSLVRRLTPTAPNKKDHK